MPRGSFEGTRNRREAVSGVGVGSPSGGADVSSLEMGAPGIGEAVSGLEVTSPGVGVAVSSPAVTSPDGGTLVPRPERASPGRLDAVPRHDVPPGRVGMDGQATAIVTATGGTLMNNVGTSTSVVRRHARRLPAAGRLGPQVARRIQPSSAARIAWCKLRCLERAV